LSGSPVRPPGSATDQLLLAMTHPVPSLAEVASLPRSLIAIVDRALAFDRAQRFPDARSMQLALVAATGVSRQEPVAPESRHSLPPSTLSPLALPIRGSRISPPRRVASPSRRFDEPVTEAAPAEPKSALPLYIGLGFAVGIGIVVAGQLTVRSAAPAGGPLTVLPEPPARAPAAAPPALPSASTSARPAPVDSKLLQKSE